MVPDVVSHTRGGRRNVSTPLRRPADLLLDAQGETDEALSLAAAARDTPMPHHAAVTLGFALGTLSLLRVIQRELQVDVEACRTAMEGRG